MRTLCFLVLFFQLGCSDRPSLEIEGQAGSLRTVGFQEIAFEYSIQATRLKRVSQIGLSTSLQPYLQVIQLSVEGGAPSVAPPSSSQSSHLELSSILAAHYAALMDSQPGDPTTPDQVSARPPRFKLQLYLILLNRVPTVYLTYTETRFHQLPEKPRQHMEATALSC